jgi:hypothetical protein
MASLQKENIWEQIPKDLRAKMPPSDVTVGQAVIKFVKLATAFQGWKHQLNPNPKVLRVLESSKGEILFGDKISQRLVNQGRPVVGGSDKRLGPKHAAETVVGKLAGKSWRSIKTLEDAEKAG